MNEAIVLFSGGIDSTYITARCAGDHDKLTLITYKVPGMVRAEASRKSSEQLIRIFGGKISHEIIDISNYVYAARGNAARCIKDNFRYGFFYSWCLGCKVAMHLYTIDRCKRTGVSKVLDGSNYYDVHALEQHEEVKDALTRIYRDNGIEYTSPFYREIGERGGKSRVKGILRHLGLLKDTTAKRAEYLRDIGIDVSRGFMSQYRACQPSCVPSLFFNLTRLIYKLFRDEKSGGYMEYIGCVLKRSGKDK